MMRVRSGMKAFLLTGLVLLAANASATEVVQSVAVTTIEYDDYGNPVSKVVETSVNEPGGTKVYRQTTLNSYTQLVAGDWLPGLLDCTLTAVEAPAEANLTAADLLKISGTTFTYFQDAARRHKLQLSTSGPVSPQVQGVVPAACQAPDSSHALQSSFAYYDHTLQLQSVTLSGPGVEARTTSYAYFAGNRKIVTTDPMGHESTLFTTAFGKPQRAIGADNVPSNYWYDVLGRNITVEAPVGAQELATYQACSSATCEANEVMFATSKRVIGGTETRTKPDVKTFLDSYGRTVRTVTAGFDGREVITKNTYNSKGQLTEQTLPYLYPQATGEKKRLLTMTYDAVGRLESTVRSTSPGSGAQSQQVNYLSAFETEFVNAKGQKRREVRDGIGRIRKITDNLGFAQQYAYDAAGKLRLSIDPKGNTTTVEYDLRGNRNKLIDPDLGTWTYETDLLGNLKQQVDNKQRVEHEQRIANGESSVLQKTTYEYDKLNRLKRRLEPDQDSRFEYRYDTGVLTTHYLDGVAPYMSQRNWHYDANGRLQYEEVDFGFDGDRWAVYGRTADGRLDSVQFTNNPNNPVSQFGYKYIYDLNGYLTEVRDTASNVLYWKVLSRDADGRPLRTQLGSSGTVSEKKYKPETDRLENSVAGPLAVDGSIIGSIQNDSYAFDDAGNLTFRSQNAGAFTVDESFGYDAGNRLVSAAVTGQTAKALKYDEVGNIAWRSDVGTYQYGQAVNVLDPAFVPGQGAAQPAVLSVNAAATGCTGVHRVCAITNGGATKSLTYDLNGNMLSGNGYSFQAVLEGQGWTSANQPGRIVDGNTIDAYHYDAGHKRRAIYSYDTSGSYPVVTDRILYLHLGIGGAYEERHKGDWQGTHGLQYTYPVVAEGQLIANFVARTVDGVAPWESAIHYPHVDNQGSVTAISNGTGAVVERFSYDVWGKRRNLDGSDAVSGTLASQWDEPGYTGHQMLDRQNLIHMGGRLFDPELARFVSADPTIDGVGTIQGFNRYAYVHNNPATLVDPSGYGAKCYSGYGCLEIQITIGGPVRVEIKSKQDGSSVKLISIVKPSTSSSTSQSGTVQYETAVYTFSANAPAWANEEYMRVDRAVQQYEQQMAIFLEIQNWMAQMAVYGNCWTSDCATSRSSQSMSCSGLLDCTYAGRGERGGTFLGTLNEAFYGDVGLGYGLNAKFKFLFLRGGGGAEALPLVLARERDGKNVLTSDFAIDFYGGLLKGDKVHGVGASFNKDGFDNYFSFGGVEVDDAYDIGGSFTFKFFHIDLNINTFRLMDAFLGNY
jgi:RHS repeat-associated protein